MTVEERLHRRRYLCSVSERQGVVSARQHHILRVRKPSQDKFPDLREPRPALGTPDVQDGLADPPGVLLPETPAQQRGYVGGEEGVGVSFDLGGSVRKVPFDVLPPVGSDNADSEPAERCGGTMQALVLSEFCVSGEELV